MPPTLRDTLIQLLALAWRSAGKGTPPLYYSELSALTGKKRRTLQSHIHQLRTQYAALRLRHFVGGAFAVRFENWVLGRPPARKNLHPPVEEEDLISPEINSWNQDSLPPPEESSGECKNLRADDANSASYRLSPAFLDELRAGGVFESLLPEVDAVPLEEDELRALLEWARADRPRAPAAIFMARLRLNASPPEEFTRPPCPRCGRHGEHAADCPHRYLDGVYADLIEH